MRAAHLWMDRGDGWEPLTSHDTAQAALAELSVEWGAKAPNERDEPPVMKFSLIDHTGTLVGEVPALLGARVLLQSGRPVAWTDLHDTAPALQTWRTTADTWAGLHESHWAPPRDQPDHEQAITLFTGTIATGTTVTQRDDGTWRLDLYATGQRVMLDTPWTGPTTGTADLIATALEQRLAELDLPPIDRTELDLLTPSDTQIDMTDIDEPTINDALDALISWHPAMPAWHELHDVDGTRLSPVTSMSTTSIVIDGDGQLYMVADLSLIHVVDGSHIIVDPSSLDVPDPVKAIQVTMPDDTVIDYDASDIVPDGIASYGETWQTSICRTAWQPDDDDRRTVSDAIFAMDSRLHPTGLAIDSRRLSSDDLPGLYTPQPSHWAMIVNRLSALVSSTGRPAVTGVWLALSGTLTYQTIDGKPVWRNEFETLHPMPTTGNDAAWNELDGWPGSWTMQQAYTWRELRTITPAN